jgi:DHA1 family inner membrane transport protein
MSAPSADRFPLFRLLVLAGAIFVSVSSEFLPTGLLPDIAGDLDVSESRVGLLITVFAFTVVISTGPLTVLTRRYSRKGLLVVLLGVFAISNVLAAVAPNYEILASARVLGGLAHGLFWAVAGPYVALLVSPTQLARAVSVTTGGGALAFILGVPFTAAIGHAVGWRWAFVTMALLVVVFAVLTVVALPAVGIVAVTVLLVATGHNLFSTYIAPWAITVAGVADDNISLLLLFYGLAGGAGLLLAGLFGDRHPRLTLNVMVIALVVTIIASALLARGLLPAILVTMLWGASFGGLPALFHTRALRAASPRTQVYAGAIMTTAFNIAIGLGALLGGVVLDELGIAVVPYVAAGVVAIAVVCVLATDRARLTFSADAPGSVAAIH